MGIYNSLRELGSAWKDAKVRQFQGTPQTKVDSGGNIERYEFGGQSPTRKELEEVRQIRESGGVISYLVHAKALMQFGTGSEYQTENEELIEWLEEQIPNVDNMLIELGEDAIWYPYAIAEIVETQGGGFSHIEMVEPWTMEPRENEFGEVIAWEQHIDRQKEVFEPEELASIILNKSSGRDNTGISEVLRAEEEIRGFKENRQTVNQALKYLVPHNHWIVGKESGQVIDDNELRRIRNRVEDMEGDTQFITGPDVEHNEISLQEFDYGGIQERDLREVALALGLPLELANIGSDGLGSGMPADLRLTLFERQARAAQRSLTNQVDEELIRPIIETYSPFSVDEYDGLRLSDPIAEREEMTLMDMQEYLTADEVREELDKPPIEDDELADSYQAPAQAEAEDEQPEGGFGGGDGFFSDGRALQEIPDNATSIDSPDECDGQVIEGPRGGMYCVPQGEDTDGGGGNVSIDEVEPGDEVTVDAVIPGPDGEPIDISDEEVEVVDVDPEYGLLINHPEFGRGEVPAEEINGITDPDAEGETDEEATADGPADSVEGIAIDDTVEGSDTILSDDEKEQIEERLTEAHGEAATENLDLANTWRQNSISGAAESLATGLKQVSGLNGDVRDSGREAPDPTPEQEEALEDMVNMSQDFFEEKFGEETELVRGTRENSRDDFLLSVFGGEESVEINANAVDNYTSEEELAANYAGDDGLVLRPTVTSDDVQLANASLFAEGFEEQGDEYLIDSPDEISADDAEVRINGESISMASEPTDMDQDDFRTLAEEMENAPDELRSAFEEWAGELA